MLSSLSCAGKWTPMIGLTDASAALSKLSSWLSACTYILIAAPDKVIASKARAHLEGRLVPGPSFSRRTKSRHPGCTNIPGSAVRRERAPYGGRDQSCPRRELRYAAGTPGYVFRDLAQLAYV